MCPACGRVVSFTKDDRLFRHRGTKRMLYGPAYLWCRASGRNVDEVRAEMTPEKVEERRRLLAIYEMDHAPKGWW